MREDFKFQPTEYETAAVILLLYPSLGPSKKYTAEQSFIASTLGEQGLVIYKSIFDNNRKELITQFFKDPLINKLWPKLVDYPGDKENPP